MDIRIVPGTIIATCILGWWIPQVNTGLRYTTVLIFVAYTGIAAVLTLRNTVFRRVAAICGGCSIGILFAPSWLIPIVALPIILLTVAYLDIGAQVIPHYLRHGELSTPEADHGNGYGQRIDTIPVSQHPIALAQRQQHSRQMEPDLDTDSLSEALREAPYER